MKVVLTVWGIVIVLCILEAYFCTKFKENEFTYTKHKTKKNV